MRLTVEEHFRAVTRHKQEAQSVLDKAMDLHKIEIIRVDDLFSKMDLLAFGIVGAILALNDSANLSSPFVLIGILFLIGNAFWDFLARLDQYELNRDSAKNRADYVHAELKEFLDVYRTFAADQTDANESKLDKAGLNFIEKMNENSFTTAPRTKLTKWIGRRGYFIIYVIAMVLIGIGLLTPNHSSNRHFEKKPMEIYRYK